MKQNGRVIDDIVAAIVKPKKKKAKEMKKKQVKKRKSRVEDTEIETISLSSYMKKVMEKRQKNAVVINKIVEEKNKKFPKKKKVARKRKTTHVKHMLPSQKQVASSECVHDHTLYSGGYKEETDRRYCKKDMELFNINCTVCKKQFSYEVKEKKTTPSFSRPVYICIGRNKYNCYHGFCYDCYQTKVADNNENGIVGRRSSRRKTN